MKIIFSVIFLVIGFTQCFATGTTYYYVGGNNNAAVTFTNGALWSSVGLGGAAAGGTLSTSSNSFVINGTNVVVGGPTPGTAITITTASNVAQLIILNNNITVTLAGSAQTFRAGLLSGSQTSATGTGITDAIYVGSGTTLNIGSVTATANSLVLQDNPNLNVANTAQILGTLNLASNGANINQLTINQQHFNSTPEVVVNGTININNAVDKITTVSWFQINGTINNSVAGAITSAQNTAGVGVLSTGGIIEFTAASPAIPAGLKTTLIANAFQVPSYGEIRFTGSGVLTLPSINLSGGGLLSVGSGYTSITGISPTYSSASTTVFSSLQYLGVGGSPAAQTVTAVEWPVSVPPNNVIINNTAGVTLTSARTIPVPTQAYFNNSVVLQAGLFTTGGNLTMGNLTTINRMEGTISATPPTAGTDQYFAAYTGSTDINTGAELPTSKLAGILIGTTNNAKVTLANADATVLSTRTGSNNQNNFVTSTALNLVSGRFDISGTPKLHIASGATVSITGNGTYSSPLIGTPIFDVPGSVNEYYACFNFGCNNCFTNYTTGTELPAVVNNVFVGSQSGSGVIQGVYHLNSNTQINGTLTMGVVTTSAGTLDINGHTLTIGDGVTVGGTSGIITGSSSRLAGSTTSDLIIQNTAAATNSLVAFDGTNVTNGTFLRNLSITKTANGFSPVATGVSNSLTINGTLTLNMTGSGNVLTLGSASTLTLNGDINHIAGTISGFGTAASPTSVLVVGEVTPGAAGQFIFPIAITGVPVRTFTLSRTNGMAFPNTGSSVFLPIGGTTNSGTLNLTRGILTTNNNIVSLSTVIASAINQTAGSWVNGNLQWGFTSTALSRTFTIGNAIVYRPVSVTFSNITTSGNLIVKTTDGNRTGIANSTINPSYTANCFWTLTNSGIVFTNYSSTFNFNGTDVSSGANPLVFTAGTTNNGTTWTTPTLGTKTATSTQITTLTTPTNGNFLDFQLGNLKSAAVGNITSANTSICRGISTNITGTVTGAVGSYTVTLSDGASQIVPSGTAFSIAVTPTTNTTYTISKVVDNGGTSYALTSNLTGSTTITILPTPSITETHVNVSCSAAANGSIDITPSDGILPYEFAWNNGATTEDVTGLSGGTYSVIVTGSNGCPSAKSVILVEPATIGGSFTGNNVICYGGTNGSASVSATGGTPPYSYLWSNGGTNSSISGLSADTYTVTITDAHGCTGLFSTTVSQPLDLSANNSGNGVSCNGGTNGSTFVTASGGTAPYTYSWFNSSTSQSISNLSAGTYSVTITDQSGCSFLFNAIVVEPAVLLANVSTVSDVSCFGEASGNVTANPTGGTAPYFYLWSSSPGQTTQTATGLAAGTYALLITDAHFCNVFDTADITQPLTSLSTNASTLLNVTCKGEGTGSATTSPTGGTGAYTYLWNSSPFQTTQTATGLTAGTYTVIVTDANNCSVSSEAIISEPANALVANASTINNINCNGDGNGAVTAAPSGGTGSYSYVWNTIPAQTTETVSGLNGGTYTVTITDGNNCIATGSAIVTEPAQLMVLAGYLAPACDGSDLYLTSSVGGGTGPFTYAWSGPNGTISPVANPTITSATNTNDAGNYLVTVTDQNGCIAGPSAVEVEVHLTPSGALFANTNADFETTICAGDGGTLMILCGGSGTITGTLWDGVSTTLASYSGTATQINIPVTPPVGTTIYYLQSMHDQYCAAKTVDIIGVDPITVHVNPSPTASITPSGPTTFCSDGSVTLDAGAGFTYLWSNGATTQTVNATASGTYSVTVTNGSNCSATSAVTTVTVNICNTTLNLKLYIQGYYAFSGSMYPVLLNQTVGASNTETDTILVELREEFNTSNVVTSAKGLLMTNGTVLSTNGVSNFEFSGVYSGNYWIAVKHRNALETWSSSAVSFATTPTYDFSSAASQALYDNQALVDGGLGLYGFYSGDIIPDGFIGIDDVNLTNNDNLAGLFFDYLATDINGDGFVGIDDVNIVNNNNLAGVFFLP